MAASLHQCPACGAELPEADPFPCKFCNWTPAEDEFPTLDPQSESRYNAETLPLPKEQADALGLELESDQPAADADEPEPATEAGETEPAADADEPAPATEADESEPAAESGEIEPQPGPATLRRLTEASQGPADREELLDQVPEELRGVLAARMQAADEAKDKGLRKETIDSLKNRGYQVTEDARGARITGGSSRSSDFSPYEMVSMAAEQEGGVQPRGKLSMCPECDSASPVGATRCQWCGADLPQE